MLGIALRVLWATSEDGIAVVPAGAGEGDASGEIFGAFGMLVAVDDRSALVGSRFVDGDALMLCIALRVLLAASEDGIAVVTAGAGEEDASGVVGSALGVHIAPNCFRAFIGTWTLRGHAAVPVIAHEMIFCVVAIPIGLAVVTTRTGNRYAEIQATNRMLIHAATEHRITSLYTESRQKNAS